ncbi:hypothetical protein ANCCAN_22813 [Ancylostoma caninum]|uniref:Uncharacterized protein n=1 Tax=Ancylostoma caninum TaxID=29170 RepID=A0A368FK77_ANCCA|nr:hypothetical protein ANCCAN_22813 [Ancylostoma caninum]
MSFNSNQLTFRFSRPLGANGARNHKLDDCQTWNVSLEDSILNHIEVGCKRGREHWYQL